MHNTDQKNLHFFDHFIPAHTVDFTRPKEVDVRRGGSIEFLERYPVPDFAFEFVVFPSRLDPASIEAQAQAYLGLKEKLEGLFPVKVHASMHFPATSQSDLFLGSDDPAVLDRVDSLFRSCTDLAVATGIQTIVLHSGGNIDGAAWDAIKDDPAFKERALGTITASLERLLGISREQDYAGAIAWENMPTPFDIPAFTFTNILVSDFTTVLDGLERRGIVNLHQLGICIDLCHAWILARTVESYGALAETSGTRTSPPGVFQHEWYELLSMADPTLLVKALGPRVNHVHLADSRGKLELDGDRVVAQPTEGDVLGDGEFSRSGVLDECLHALIEKLPTEKVICTLEIKDADFTNPVKTFRSLNVLGSTYF
jgi:sugar phosphate isomerase/epimerase